MASLAKIVMDKAYARSREELDNDNFSESFGFQAFESMVNNVKHGKYPTEWIPQIAQIYSNLEGFDEGEQSAIKEMLSFTYATAAEHGYTIPTV